MYRIKEIQDKLLNVVGWEQSFDPNNQIAERLTATESGLYFQGAHPLVTLENMAAIMPDNWGFQYPGWNETTEYKAGKVVTYANDAGGNKKYWAAIVDNVGQMPGDGSTFWEPYNILSDWLERITRNGISTAIQTFTQIKQLDKETKNLLERRALFDGAGRIRATQNNTHKLVGFEIVPVRAMGVTTKIERIGLQMTGATGTVKMYLFHSSQIDPIKTFDLEFTVTNGGFQWFTMTDLYLPYISDANNAGGAWFLCYNQDELPAGMQAINMMKDWSREPCGTCTGYVNIEAWRQITKYLQVSPFMMNVPETFAEYPELWDVALTMYTNTQNYGLNCEITVGCDLTDFIVEQRAIFQTVIQRQVAAIALRTLAMNPNVRVNRNQSNASRMEILYELDGNVEGRPGGLGYDLKKAFEALRLDTQGIDRICLSCNNHGVKYRTT